MIQGLTGVVLAGGRSSRFGSNKALADWAGTALVAAVAGSLRRVAPRVLVVAKDTRPLAFLEGGGVEVVADSFREDHPLGGIHTGLERSRTRHAFVCACDMPFLQPRLIETLWEARADYDAVIPVWEQRRQPLCGIYAKGCAGLLRASIERASFGIARLFDSLKTRFFLEEEVRRADPAGLSFLDIDTREDYERARRLRGC